MMISHFLILILNKFLLIVTNNLSLDHILHDNFSFEAVYEYFSIKRESFSCLHSESFYSLYPDIFLTVIYLMAFTFSLKLLYGQILV
jgi:hypothetical protein